MKLIIQIPCFDEADALPTTLAALPRTVEGFDQVEYLVVDDGSSDDTAGIARRHGVHHVVRHPQNRGLAAAFMTGIASCLALGADVIVTTDGDNQYFGGDIPALVAPVRDGRADFAMGVRPVRDRRYFPLWKSVLTRIGTLLAQCLSGLAVQDAPSGLRAYSARAARCLRVTGHFSYTMETLVQAGSLKWTLASVPIRVNPIVRPSRLMSSVPQYIRKSTYALFRGVALHRPLFGFIVVAAIGALPMILFDAWHLSRIGALAWSPVALALGLAGCTAGGGWIWRMRRRAATMCDNSTAAIGSNALCGDDFAGLGIDEKEPLADMRPVASVGMPLAATAGERCAGG